MREDPFRVLVLPKDTVQYQQSTKCTVLSLVLCPLKGVWGRQVGDDDRANTIYPIIIKRKCKLAWTQVLQVQVESTSPVRHTLGRRQEKYHSITVVSMYCCVGVDKARVRMSHNEVR